MKSSLEKVSNLERKLRIEIPLPQVQAAFEKAFTDIQKSVTIKGFRKGKAPLPTIRSIYSGKVKQDVVQDLVQENYWAALKEHQLNPAGAPVIECDPIAEDSDFKFSAGFEILPEVTLTNYENLPVLREKMPDIEARMEDALAGIRENRATETPVLEDRPARAGDIAIVDFEGFVQGQPFDGGKASDLPLVLGSKKFIEGFEDGVIGMKPAETKTLQLKFPGNYHVQGLAGQDVRFDVKLKALKTKSLPDLTDEFATNLGGGYASLEDFKKRLRDTIQRDEERRIRDDLKGRILRALVERNSIEVPKTLHEKQKEELMEDVARRIQDDGGSASDAEEYKRRWDGEFNKSATFMIQCSLLLDALAEKLSLSATEDEIETKLQEYASDTGIELSKIKEHYVRRSARSRLAFKITEEKVIDFLLSKAQISEVTSEELAKNEATDVARHD